MRPGQLSAGEPCTVPGCPFREIADGVCVEHLRHPPSSVALGESAEYPVDGAMEDAATPPSPPSRPASRARSTPKE